MHETIELNFKEADSIKSISECVCTHLKGVFFSEIEYLKTEISWVLNIIFLGGIRILLKKNHLEILCK